jgi:hypothetical protein
MAALFRQTLLGGLGETAYPFAHEPIRANHGLVEAKADVARRD